MVLTVKLRVVLYTYLITGLLNVQQVLARLLVAQHACNLVHTVRPSKEHHAFLVACALTYMPKRWTRAYGRPLLRMCVARAA